ncbi:MAG: radical SAM family heme chaperone HemW [candidate division Zixibacteria bacterium]|nr:radical SAM family heme chaperone HemW [candidate division Zixibacteria bacterium]
MPFGLYLHFPFCRNKCSYCDFYKELYDARLEVRFFEALKIETELAAMAFGPFDREISTIFIGGGTPTLSNPDLLAGWLEQLRRLFIVPDGIEFSIENNPDSVTAEKLTTFRQLGVNRPTFGIQSFKPQLLQLLNRKHNPADSARSVYLTNALGYTNFGADLIFGLPRQTSKMLSEDIDELIDLDPPHISFYQLTVEPHTTLAERVQSGSLVMPDPDLSLALYRGGCARLAEAGYIRYEVSSFAKPGFECRHNMRYWDGSDYLGLGPSAHSFMIGQRFANVPDVEQYIHLLSQGRRPVIADVSGIAERMVEAIMLGLRTSKGIDRQRFAVRFGRSVEERIDLRQYGLFVKSGHVIDENETIRLSDDGICVADEIIRRLVN